MPTKKTPKKGGFTLAPILLSQPVPETDGFSNLVEDAPAPDDKPTVEAAPISAATVTETASHAEESDVSTTAMTATEPVTESLDSGSESPQFRLTVEELLRILDADSLDDVYELTDVLRASSLKLYATLVTVADERGRARIKNFELMEKAGIKGIATLYKQERWLSSLRLVEKKAKPGPHDGSSYVVFPLETLPLPDEIHRKFAGFMASLK